MRYQVLSHTGLVLWILWAPLGIASAEEAPTPGMGTFQVVGTVTDKTVDVLPGFDEGCPDTPTVELWIGFGDNTVPAFCLGNHACGCKAVEVSSVVAVRGRLIGSRVNAGDPLNEAWIVVLELEDITVLQDPTLGEPRSPALAYVQESR